MDHNDLLVDGLGRLPELVHAVVDGLDEDQLAARPDGGNSIAWLVWHLTRVQDVYVAAMTGASQVWLTEWADRFALPFDREASGYGQGPDEVAAVRVSAELLTGYFDAASERTLEFIRAVAASDLDKVVDENWDPPVTLGVRLISILSDDLQHIGQAAYVRGLIT